jgi:hypothetical protein
MNGCDLDFLGVVFTSPFELAERGDLEILTTLSRYGGHTWSTGVGSRTVGCSFVGFEGGHAEGLESGDELS